MFDLAVCAHQEMIAEGFDPDFPPEVERQVAALAARAAPVLDGGLRDLRQLPWSSIDNDSSRDLDQIEAAARVDGGIRVLVGIADVNADVEAGSPIDVHAAAQTTSVYTGVRTFPMLPEQLSTDLTSLSEGADRRAVVVEFVVSAQGEISAPAIYRALVRNKAQLTYNAVGPWLEGTAAAPKKLAASAELAAQLKMQDEAAQALREQRHRLGALSFERPETQPILTGDKVTGIAIEKQNRAGALIEDFMVGANEVMAQTLTEAGVSSIRRVVKTPERWPRIVELAAQHGGHLPAQPDAVALSAFLAQRKAADPDHFADVSLTVIKLMGPGEYVLMRPGEDAPGHFALAAHDYTHSTAPNRRFADLVTQRLIGAVLAKQPAPYSDDALDGIARNCTLKEDAARKVERIMQKRIAAVALAGRVGESFPAVVTGVTPKGVFVRVIDPPIEGRLMRGEQGVDVGDRVRVTLLATDPQRGFIDFGR
ncbi:MAG TPA: RNB domain-containing ribonuclease [Bryobacteraceae bacterium]|nr:RNB domain-containing ribonuclease [Bryobacteraceae bacterium]